MTARRVLLYVQHLLGIGHLKRSATLADAMTCAGLEVTFVTGGFKVPGLVFNARHIVQLPPAGAADLSFKEILDASGNPVDAQWRQQRADLLLDAWRVADPHVLLIELFPFGRRQMRFELIPLLDAASAATRRPVIVCSVRDILGGGQKDPARQEQMLELFERYFDQLLVHGDPSWIPFDKTFRHAARLGTKLHYTGYVVDRQPLALSGALAGKDEVIVSVGGGAVGLQLLQTALRARALCVLSKHRWRLLAGAQINDADLQRLTTLAHRLGGSGILVERNRPDFVQLLANCRLSVSQGGYNTVMETLQAHAPAVIVPFAGGSEAEQTLRARLLAQRGWIDVVEESVLNPHSLADAINRAARRPRPIGHVVRLDGAARSAAMVAGWAKALPC